MTFCMPVYQINYLVRITDHLLHPPTHLIFRSPIITMAIFPYPTQAVAPISVGLRRVLPTQAMYLFHLKLCMGIADLASMVLNHLQPEA